MHELSVCEALLRQVEAIAKQHQAKTVTAIKLQLGLLCGVEADLLQQAFTIARAGTFAEQAELQIEIVPVRARCQLCGAESEVSPQYLVCKSCGDWHVQVVSGEEMLLARVECEL